MVKKKQRRKHRKLSNEEKGIEKNRYRNVSEKDTQKLKQYQKTMVFQKIDFIFFIKYNTKNE